MPTLSLYALPAAKLEATAKECEALGGEVFYRRTDLCVKEDMEQFVKETVDRFGTIDILINNAISICPPHTFPEHTEEELQLTMQSGFLATWCLMLLCFPYMKDKASSIVNFGSTSGEPDNLSPEMKDYIMEGFKKNPLCRIGDPYDDITPAVVFPASDDSRWVTGQNLNVEGGGNIHS